VTLAESRLEAGATELLRLLGQRLKPVLLQPGSVFVGPTVSCRITLITFIPEPCKLCKVFQFGDGL
jgi:hypothetical protein